MQPIIDEETFNVTILVLPESSMMCVASVLEPMRGANRVAGKQLYSWQVVGLAGSEVNTTCDVALANSGSFLANQRGDLLVIVAGFNHKRYASASVLGRIRQSASGFRFVAGIEAGSWVLARAGLLNGHSATTHWEDFESFKESYPEIDVKHDRFVIDGRFMTCGGALPAFDMFLDLVRRRNGPATAMDVASVFIYSDSQSQYDSQPLVSLGRREKEDPRLGDAIRLMEKFIEQPIPVGAIAKRGKLTSRTLEKIFKSHTGMTPGRFYLSLRLKAANRLVKGTGLSVQEIAVRTGFNSLSAFSRAYRREFEVSPKQMRINAVERAEVS